MSKKIVYKKATRIEGNADIHVEVEAGRIKTARFEVMDFRGFEKFTQGKQVDSVPHMVSRICGLCCTAHQVAGFRAIENALGVELPPDARRLRDVALMGETIASHALSFFFLTLPDKLGASNGIFDLMQNYPTMASDAFALRKSGSRILEILCKRAVHPVAIGLGSFTVAPSAADMDELHNIAAFIKDRSFRLIEGLGKRTEDSRRINFPKDHAVNFFTFDNTALDGREMFKTFNKAGDMIMSFSPSEFEENISEVRVDWSFAKLPYLSSFGFPDGVVLVGPLSRLFMENGVLSDTELEGMKLVDHLRDTDSLTLDDFDICRVLEIFSLAKRILSLLEEVNLSRPLKTEVDRGASGRGIGVVEAPRGVLVHDYTVNRGAIEKMSLYVATQFNNAFINFVLRDLADNYVEGESISVEGQEMLAYCVRLFDPCLTCATH